MEWYGRKLTFAACVIATTGCAFIQFFARSLPVLLTGELLGGLVLGTYAVIAPAYASEVCPVALRGIFTAYVNLCFVMGQLIANGVIAGTSTLSSHWAYSAPFAVQWLWPAVILVGLPFAPESPWWLVRKGRTEDAEKALKRLASLTLDIKPTLAMIIETDRIEYGDGGWQHVYGLLQEDQPKKDRDCRWSVLHPSTQRYLSCRICNVLF
jgi:MFS transporter, SP family, general alpha glucoside:H+ symporter